MATSIGSRIKSAWNAFLKKEPVYYDYGGGYSYQPSRTRMTRGNDRTIVTSVYNRIAMDVAGIGLKHVRMDKNGRFTGTIDSDLNRCLTLEANIDQTSRAFVQDVVLSMFDEGVVAIVPVDATNDPCKTKSFDVLSMRTGKIMEWYPRHVRINVYNDQTGNREEVIMPKETVAIIENPFYSVMNEPSSTVRRLTRKLALLDQVDEQNSSGKLDLIIQLPYVIKTDARRQEAEKRRKDVENQLMNSKYGVAYTDGTERITQLNRSVENQLLTQIQYLNTLFMSQLGITQEIMNGTADEKTMLNYQTRTVEPIISAIVDAMKCAFLSQTARTQGQSINYFLDPFKLVPVSQIADIADRLTRNEVVTSNEIRQIIGMMPSNDPNADVLRNKNISQPDAQAAGIDQPPVGQNEVQRGREILQQFWNVPIQSAKGG